LKHRFEVTPSMQHVFAHRYERMQHEGAEQAQAQRSWERRELALGLTPGMTMDASLQRIRQARTQAITHAPERRRGHELEHEVETLTHAVAGLEGYVHDVQRTQRLEHRLEQSHGPYEWRQMRDAEKVLANGVQHGLPRDAEAEKLVAQLTRYLAGHEQEPQAGAALNVKIFREAEHDRGMGW